MHLCDVLRESAVLIDLPGLDKWGVIAKLTEVMVEGAGQPGWYEPIKRALIEREKQSSTGMQDGFAIPHCRMDDPIQHTLVSLAILKQGMDFEAIDGEPTHLVVGLVTPRKQNQEHLRVLAGIAQLFASAAFRQELLGVETPAQALEVIRAREERLA